MRFQRRSVTEQCPERQGVLCCSPVNIPSLPSPCSFRPRATSVFDLSFEAPTVNPGSVRSPLPPRFKVQIYEQRSEKSKRERMFLQETGQSLHVRLVLMRPSRRRRKGWECEGGVFSNFSSTCHGWPWGLKHEVALIIFCSFRSLPSALPLRDKIHSTWHENPCNGR